MGLRQGARANSAAPRRLAWCVNVFGELVACPGVTPCHWVTPSLSCIAQGQNPTSSAMSAGRLPTLYGAYTGALGLLKNPAVPRSVPIYSGSDDRRTTRA